MVCFDSLAATPQLLLQLKVRVIFQRTEGSARGFAKLRLEVPIKDVELWWPRGYGDQPLYPLVFTFTPGKQGCGTSEAAGNRNLRGISDPMDSESDLPAVSGRAPIKATCGRNSTVTRKIGFRLMEVGVVSIVRSRSSWSSWAKFENGL